MSWRALRVKRGGRWGWNTVVRETVRGRAGAYAFRDSSGQVLYVGESELGARSGADLRMWKTITRHFQDPTGKWADHYTKHVGGKPFRRAAANDLEVQVWLTSPGQAALDEQARLIARLKPTHNVDDGRAVDTSFEFGANVKNPAEPFNNPPTSPPAARREYERKHWGHKARGVARSLEVVDPSHGSLVELGRLDRVEYVTSKKGDPSRATYFHDFEGERPVLAFHVCDRARCPDRGKLVIAGGSYRVEDRGIVG